MQTKKNKPNNSIFFSAISEKEKKPKEEELLKSKRLSYKCANYFMSVKFSNSFQSLLQQPFCTHLLRQINLREIIVN